MHRTCKTWPALCKQCSGQVRQASSAAAYKPKPLYQPAVSLTSKYAPRPSTVPSPGSKYARKPEVPSSQPREPVASSSTPTWRPEFTPHSNSWDLPRRSQGPPAGNNAGRLAYARKREIEESERNFGLKPRSAVVDSLPREVPQRRPLVPQQTMPPSPGPLVEPRAEDIQVNNVDQLQDQLDPRYADMPLETDAAEFDSHDNRNKRVSPKPKSRTSIVQELEQRRAVPLVNPRFNNPDKPKHGATQNKLSLVQKRLEDRQQHKRVPKMLQKTVKADVYIPSVVSVGALAQLLNVRLPRLQQRMRQAGMAEETSYDYVLTSDYAFLLAEEFGRNPVVDDEKAFDIYPAPPHPEPSKLPIRPPVVTIMGHVDHGKTTLLDNLRSASVAKGEAGGITQHIGAFSVPVKSNSSGVKSITFLDTPGHAAFSAMRARGTRVTDIVVLVVAADDGVMPQTKEVINLIKQDPNVGLVVALNKTDKPGVDIDAVQKQIMAEGIQLEVFGGDVPCVAVSGMTGAGLPELVETLSALAEMQELGAEETGMVQGHVLESRMQKGLGAVSTVLVLRGCLKPGSHIISGTHYAKVRAMSDSAGKPVKAALPGMAVTVSGWKSLPSAGDEVLQGSEADIKKAVTNRQRKIELDESMEDVEAINASRREERIQKIKEMKEAEKQARAPALPLRQSNHTGKDEQSGPKELRLVVKADVSGSAEAVVGALQGIGNHIACTKVVSSGVGDITESDVQLAKTIGGMVVGFSVNAPRPIQMLANETGVTIASSDVIYRLMDDVKERVIELLPKIVETSVTGEANVAEIFEIKIKGKQSVKVAGCRVNYGLMERNKKVKVVRNGETIFTGTMQTLKHLKKEVDEVRKGSDCGLCLHDFEDFMPGDMVQTYATIEKPGIL